MDNFTQIATEWLNLYTIHMLEISLFILLVWLTERLVRLDTKLRYLLWMLALVKVFFPPIISLPQTITATLPEQVRVLPIIASIEVTGESHPQSFSFVAVLFGLWLLVGLSLAAFIAYKNMAAHYRLRNAKSIDCLKGLAAGVPIHQSDKVKVPVLMGVIRPRLYLPADWQSWPESQVESVIAHEKAHFENRDVWVLSLQYVGIILFWPNPLLWFLHFRLNQLRELRCDETAISQTGIAPSNYSQFLVDCLEKQMEPDPLIIGKYFFKNKKSIKARINHLLNFKESQMRHQKLFRFGLPLVLVMLMFVFSWRCSRSASLVEPTMPAEAESGNMNIFIAFDSPPRPVGGFKAIQEALQYPEIARKAGIEGRVFVQVLVSETGEVVDTRVVKSMGEESLDQAAIEALKSVEWEPAKKEGKPVKVWVSIPILFKLPGEETAGLKPAPAPSNNNAFEFQIPNVNSESQAFDTPPRPVGGFKAIHEKLKYPEGARKAGIEGKVFVQVKIDEAGKVVGSRIVKSLGDAGADEAAVDALKSVEWEPAKLNGIPVKVWVSIPVHFRLRAKEIKSMPPPAPKDEKGAAVQGRSAEGNIESEARTSSVQITIDENQRIFLDGKEVALTALTEKLDSMIKNGLTQVRFQLYGNTPMGLLNDIQKQLRLADQVERIEYKMLERYQP